MMELTLTSPDDWHLHLRNGDLLAAVVLARCFRTFFSAHAVKTIVSAVTSGSNGRFIGTHSAPHERHRKKCSCGCAGIFNAPVALSLYSKIFEEANALDKLEAFTSFDGPDSYGLPRNTSKLKLIKEPWKVPEFFEKLFLCLLGKCLAGRHLDTEIRISNYGFHIDPENVLGYRSSISGTSVI